MDFLAQLIVTLPSKSEVTDSTDRRRPTLVCIIMSVGLDCLHTSDNQKYLFVLFHSCAKSKETENRSCKKKVFGHPKCLGFLYLFN